MKTIILIIFGFLLSGNSLAEIYEIIDENGNKTYTNTIPFNKTDQTLEKMTTQKANVIEGDQKQLDANKNYFDDLAKKQNAEQDVKDKQKQALKDAYQQVKDAEAALETAKTVKAGDLIRNKNGRMLRRPQYTERINAAEAALQKAKDNLQSVRQNKTQASQ